MKINLDTDLCGGHGDCSYEAPELFEVDPKTDRVHLLRQPTESDREAAEKAAKYCPNFVISVES